MHRRQRELYEYRELNSIAISVINDVKTSYLIAVGEALSITPTLEFALGEERDECRYEWHQMIGSPPYQTTRLLSAERNLSLKIEGSMRYAGTYYLMYCVTNLATGVRYNHLFTVAVQNRISQGYIVLHEQRDNFGIDLIASYGDTLTHYPDVLGMFGSTLPGPAESPSTCCATPTTLRHRPTTWATS